MRRCVSALAVLLLVSVLISCGKPSTQQPAQQTNQSSTNQPEGAQSAQPPVQQQTPAQVQQNTGTTPAPQPGLRQGSKARAKTAEEGTAPNAAAKASAFTPVALPTGTVLTVRMGESVSSKTSQAGQKFTATLAEPVEVDGTTVIPKGAEASGHVTTAVPKGRFKGEAKLGIVLDTIAINGKTYDLKTASVLRREQGKGKRTGAMIGGGAGLGALVGGLAGGGKGAAIGALAGAGAGTAGAAFTGNKDITIPAEAAMSFKLLEPVQIK